MTRKEKFIYVCSPYQGNVFANKAKAVRYSRRIYQSGNIPICVHFYLNEATGLSEEFGDRKELLRLGKRFIELCDQVWVFGSGKVSEGMKGEIEYAKLIGVKVEYK